MPLLLQMLGLAGMDMLREDHACRRRNHEHQYQLIRLTACLGDDEQASAKRSLSMTRLVTKNVRNSNELETKCEHRLEGLVYQAGRRVWD